MALSEDSVGPWLCECCREEVFKQITEGTNHKGKDWYVDNTNTDGQC